MKGPHATLLAVTGMSLLLSVLGCALQPTRHAVKSASEPDTRKSFLGLFPTGSTVLQAKGEATATVDQIATVDTVAYAPPLEIAKAGQDPLPGTTVSSEDLLLPPCRPSLLVEPQPQISGPPETPPADGFEMPASVPDLQWPMPLHMDDVEEADGESLPAFSAVSPMTLHMDDLDVRKALEMLSRQTNMNILVSPGG